MGEHFALLGGEPLDVLVYFRPILDQGPTEPAAAERAEGGAAVVPAAAFGDFEATQPPGEVPLLRRGPDAALDSFHIDRPRYDAEGRSGH